MVISTHYALTLIRNNLATVVGRTIDGHAILNRNEFSRVDHATCSDSEYATADERRLYAIAASLSN